jgi:hypothetical protein
MSVFQNYFWYYSNFRSGSFSAAVPSEDVPETLGAVAWWDPNSGVTAGTGVASWTDRINGYSLANATGAEQPTISSINGVTALSFARASSQKLYGAATLAAALDGTADFSICYVGKVNGVGSATEYRVAVHMGDSASTTATFRHGIYNSSTTGTTTEEARKSAGTALSGPKNWGTEAITATITCQGSTTMSTYLNGELGATVTPGSDTWNQFALGSQRLSGAWNHHWDGWIGDVIVFNRVLSAADRATVETWLMNRYAIATQNIPNTLGAVAWWDPSTGLTYGTGVSAWADRIGSQVLSNTTGAEQPITGSISGRQALTFARASSQKLYGASTVAGYFGGTSNNTFAAVLYNAAGEAGGDVRVPFSVGFSGSGECYRHSTNDAAGTGQIYRNGAIGGGANIGYSARRNLTVTYDGSFSTPYVSQSVGTALASSTNIGSTNQIAVGGMRYTGTWYHHWDGQIGDVIAFNKVLTRTELGTLENWLNARYLVSGSQVV